MTFFTFWQDNPWFSSYLSFTSVIIALVSATAYAKIFIGVFEMTEQELDYLHDQGKVLDWWYYQKSSKPIWMKWQEQEKNSDADFHQQKQDQEMDNQLQEIFNELVEEELGDYFT